MTPEELKVLGEIVDLRNSHAALQPAKYHRLAIRTKIVLRLGLQHSQNSVEQLGFLLNHPFFMTILMEIGLLKVT